jgi:hypothetical protein
MVMWPVLFQEAVRSFTELLGSVNGRDGVQNGQFHVVEEFALRKEIEALGLQFLSDGGVFCNEAYVIDRTDAQTGRGQAELVPVLLDKRVEEGVRGGLVTLAWLVDECDKGACHEEKVQTGSRRHDENSMHHRLSA